jgi:tRNA threonylcarbamoyladenosine biosynthesis protein TsaB
MARCSVGVSVAGEMVASAMQDVARGHAAILPPMAAAALCDAGLAADDLDAVIATVGPGSFTGLRAALSLAHGLALGAGCPVVGVTVGEALAEAVADRLPAGLAGRMVWSAINQQRGQVFLETADGVHTTALAALPRPAGPVAVAGDAAQAVACRLAARGTNVMLTRFRLPAPADIARVGARRLAGEIAARAAQPLYVDPPATRLPATPPRPPPV